MSFIHLIFRSSIFAAQCVLLITAPAFAQTRTTLPTAAVPNFKKDTVNIARTGAIADGLTLNTTAIQNAIDASNKKGGGVVKVPRGLWLTGPLVLKSNVNLFVDRDAILLFTPDFNQYTLVETNWEGLPQMRNQSPLSATGAVNIAITGNGIIDGSGDAWRQVKKDKLTETQWKKLVASGGVVSPDNRTWYPSEKSVKGSKTPNAGAISPDKTKEYYEEIKDFLRPNLLVFTRCKKVLLEGVTFQNSPAWCLHPLMSEDITLRNLTVRNPWYAQNGDGVDLESCKNVVIENSSFDVGDDGICIKSGRDQWGRDRAMPTENVVVRNCVVYHAHGGFVIGSEMSGGARNIYVYDCSFIGTDIGLRFKTTRGRGGVVEKIFASNINMVDIAGEAILFDMYYMAKDPVPLAGEKREAPRVEFKPVSAETPQFRDFVISNVTCNGAEKAIFVRGLPEMNIKNIVLENMTLKAKKAIECSEASGISFRNIEVLSDETSPVVDILNSSNLSFYKLRYKTNSELLFRLAGDRTSQISIENTDASKAREKIRYEFGASEKNVTIK